MIQDAQCPDRRESFRKLRIKNANLSFDGYLRFLAHVQKAFTKAANHAQQSPEKGFKL